MSDLGILFIMLALSLLDYPIFGPLDNYRLVRRLVELMGGGGGGIYIYIKCFIYFIYIYIYIYICTVLERFDFYLQ